MDAAPCGIQVAAVIYWLKNITQGGRVCVQFMNQSVGAGVVEPSRIFDAMAAWVDAVDAVGHGRWER